MSPPTGALIEALRQLAGVIGALTREQYTMRPGEFSGSFIGTHVRHCLDHVTALVAAAESGVVDYDHRERGTPIESSPAAALEMIERLVEALDRIPDAAAHRPVTLRAVVSAEEPPVELVSSLGREIAYVVSHTTHHSAIIGFLARALGGGTPDRFGYAASTLAWMAETRCAQ